MISSVAKKNLEWKNKTKQKKNQNHEILCVSTHFGESGVQF